MAAALVLAGCGPDDTSMPSTPPPPASAAAVAQPVPATTAVVVDTLARYDGYGELRFGMDEAAFDAAWAGKLKAAAAPDSSCFYKSPAWVTLPRDFGFMFENGRFVRYDVGVAKEAAPGGGKVGMSEAQIRTLYGARIATQPHKYVDGAKYLRIAAPAGNGVLLFETDEHGKVTRWRVGVPPQVDYFEGCG
ncbi:lectin [Rhodanobacter ginsengiterrae]|uniref:lectin n=1 Tax=Rhodanobacter ginsengiterrae TaxID=2008451 RepID=UPI003CE6C2B1